MYNELIHDLYTATNDFILVRRNDERLLVRTRVLYTYVLYTYVGWLGRVYVYLNKDPLQRSCF